MKKNGYDIRNKKSKVHMPKLLLCLAMLFVISLGTIVFGGQTIQKERVYYQSVMVHQGDTLWDIAKKYKSETETTEHMIDKIQECNQMRSANIKAGVRILVPMTEKVS